MATFGSDSDAPREISNKVLSQFSGAVADPYTVHVASIMFKDFKLGTQGQRRVNGALSNLPNFFTPDEKLTFGWGDSHIIRNNAVHQGYEHLAIMVALAESFHSGWAAEVCHEMAKSVAAPDDTLPHLSQWVGVLQTGNGAFASIDFGVTVEDFIRLDPYNLTIGVSNKTPLPVMPRQIVAALHALRDVVTGKEKELILTGSAMLGWFAAVAELLYDLHVAIFSSEGEALSGTKSGEEPQIRIVYREKPGIEVSFGSKVAELPHHMSHLGITSQQYAKSIHSTPFGGRVVWQSLLPRVFGASFAHLDREESRTFSGIIGAAARMFEGLALGEGAEEDLISAQNKSNPSSYGAGLVDTLCAWLPELRRFQGRMERALKLDYHTASAAYVENISKLREACKCGVCWSKPGDENSGQGPDHGYCLVVIAEGVIAMGLALSRVSVGSGIFPCRAGIQGLYASQVKKRLEARGMRWQDHFRIVYGNEWNAPNSRRLQTCVALFSGSWPEKSLPDNVVALVHESCMAYFLKLEKSTPRPDEQFIIRVSSGTINIRQKLFRIAAFGPVADQGADDLWERVDVVHLDKPLYCK